LTSSPSSPLLLLIHSGDHFGEYCLLYNKPNRCTVKTVTAGTFLKFTKEAFETICHRNPATAAELRVRHSATKAHLRDLLFFPQFRQSFSHHLELEFGLENLKFFDDCTFYEWIDVEDKEALGVEGRRLWDTYVKDGSPQQVNIHENHRKHIATAVQSGKFDPHTFVVAKDEILKLMARDNFPRYKQTPEFRTTLTAIGVFLDVLRENDKEEEELLVKLSGGTPGVSLIAPNGDHSPRSPPTTTPSRRKSTSKAPKINLPKVIDTSATGPRTLKRLSEYYKELFAHLEPPPTPTGSFTSAARPTTDNDRRASTPTNTNERRTSNNANPPNERRISR